MDYIIFLINLTILTFGQMIREYMIEGIQHFPLRDKWVQ